MSDSEIVEAQELIRRTARLWAAIHPAHSHLLQWVISPNQLGLIRSWTKSQGWYTQPLAPDMRELMFGMTIRVDEHAANPMLELR